MGAIKPIGNFHRSILLSNSVAIIFLLAAAFIFGFIKIYAKHLNPPLVMFVPVLIVFVLPIVLNQQGFHQLSRILLSCAPSIILLSCSIYTKLHVEEFTFNDFYNFRLGLVTFCTIPFLLFSLREKLLLISTTLICFLCLALSDGVHHLFNVGFYDIGFTDKHYDFINFPSIVSAMAIMGGIVTLKRIIEKQEEENNQLVVSLQKSNAEIADQRDVLATQGQKLSQHQRALQDAYETIEKHKKRLEEELVVYDYEVTQFSYSVCHHLRGPVASLSGLVNLLGTHEAHDKEILGRYFRKSIHQLEEVVADLNYILHVRKDIMRFKNLFSIEQLLAGAKRLLEKEIYLVKPSIEVQIESPEIYTTYSALENVMYNLLSNSLKFRKDVGELKIQISSVQNPQTNRIEIRIRDNGLGIDLERFSGDVFKMYKRFHLHKEGKGLGLYLAKIQVNAMGGEISVESKVNEFTEFIVALPYKEIEKA